MSKELDEAMAEVEELLQGERVRVTDTVTRVADHLKKMRTHHGASWVEIGQAARDHYDEMVTYSTTARIYKEFGDIILEILGEGDDATKRCDCSYSIK